MKRFRGLTFKIFFLLFMSFMVMFIFLMKEKYDGYFDELIHSSHEKTEIAYYGDYLSQKYNQYINNQEEYDLDDLKKDIKNTPKTIDSVICLLDKNGKLIEKSGFNEDDDYIYLKSYSNNTTIDQSQLINHYFIDVSSLTSVQRKLLIECIETSETSQFYFDGEMRKIDGFQYTSDDINAIKENYFIVRPTYLHYEKDILGAMLFEYAKQGYFIGYFHQGEILQPHLLTESFSYQDIHDMIEQMISQKFDDVYIHQLSHDVEISGSIYNGLHIEDQDTMKILFENQELFSNAQFKKVADDYSYMMNANVLLDSHDQNKIAGYIVCFYDFSNQGTHSVMGELFDDNQEMILLSLFFIIGFSYFISYLITRRIKLIDRVAMRIADNRFDMQLPTKGHDELSSLSSHINVMSANLKRNIDQLHLEIDQVKKMENLRKEFVANFTHEIKTPLAIINGNIDLLEEANNQKKRQQYIDVINKEIDIINDLVLQMLDLSKLEAKAITLEKEKVNVTELCEDIIDEYEQLFMEKSLLIDFDSEEIEIVADKKRIAMVIQNYLSNAVKHALYRSTIHISIKNQRFSIENQGEHIAEDMMEMIWQSFISNDRQGTGLGLAICKNILELHDFGYGVCNTEDGVMFFFDWSESDG